MKAYFPDEFGNAALCHDPWRAFPILSALSFFWLSTWSTALVKKNLFIGFVEDQTNGESRFWFQPFSSEIVGINPPLSAKPKPDALHWAFINAGDQDRGIMN
ncbi:hypothetical protein [Pararhodonellum marinum]|uniref:hypothetical protein n=1 Tax=Pararhodonellum marinum TaxID=2755358 RepID=UPI0018907CA4|nr:hypothetical protein [Pararhodonellum marinum]